MPALTSSPYGFRSVPSSPLTGRLPICRFSARIRDRIRSGQSCSNLLRPCCGGKSSGCPAVGTGPRSRAAAFASQVPPAVGTRACNRVFVAASAAPAASSAAVVAAASAGNRCWWRRSVAARNISSSVRRRPSWNNSRRRRPRADRPDRSAGRTAWAPRGPAGRSRPRRPRAAPLRPPVAPPLRPPAAPRRRTAVRRTRDSSHVRAGRRFPSSARSSVPGGTARPFRLIKRPAGRVPGPLLIALTAPAESMRVKKTCARAADVSRPVLRWKPYHGSMTFVAAVCSRRGRPYTKNDSTIVTVGCFVPSEYARV